MVHWFMNYITGFCVEIYMKLSNIWHNKILLFAYNCAVYRINFLQEHHYFMPLGTQRICRIVHKLMLQNARWRHEVVLRAAWWRHELILKAARWRHEVVLLGTWSSRENTWFHAAWSIDLFITYFCVSGSIKMCQFSASMLLGAQNIADCYIKIWFPAFLLPHFRLAAHFHVLSDIKFLTV